MTKNSITRIFWKCFGSSGMISRTHRAGRAAKFFVCFAVLTLAGLSASMLAQETAFTRAASVVQPQAYVSLQPVPRGRGFEIAVVAKVTPGFHINAHEPSEEYLIPTKITGNFPAGISVVETDYPRGVMRAFRFSKTPLRVYDGSFTLRMKMRAGNAAAMGRQKISMILGYQACDQDSCLPPTKVPVEVELEVAAADTPARPANPDVFASPGASKSQTQR